MRWMWAVLLAAVGIMGAATSAATAASPLASDCFWFGPRGMAYTDGAHAANNYPDADATYWFARVTLPPGSHLELHGRYPHARYMSLSAYTGKEPSGALLDADIAPDAGATNPFRPGARRDRPQRGYTATIVAAPRPADPAPNTLYTGSDSTDVALAYRVYVNDRGTDVAGDGGLPQPTLVNADGSRVTAAAAVCAAVNRPDRGAQTSPPMTLDQWNTLLNTPGLDPATAPATPPPSFQRFFNGVFNFVGDFRPQTRTTLTPPDTGGGFSNADSRYVYASINRRFGPVVVLKGTLPVTPRTRAGQKVMGSGQLRYWSLCTNKTPVSGQTVDCVTDDGVALRGHRQYTIVISRPEDRPANATARCGVTWLDWGTQTEAPADPDYGLVLLRNMVASPGFAQAAQRVTTFGTEREVMGDYLPTGAYTTKAGFEHGGCATPTRRHGLAVTDTAAQAAYRAGLQAYVHAFPVILHRLSQRTFPVNTLVSINALTKPVDRLIVLPNVDTVYTVGKLDLRNGPLVVHVPALAERYFELQLMDAYTNVAGYIGTRTTGPGPGDYAIVGPGDTTPIPAGMPVLRSPTMDALLLGRTLVNSPAELPMLKGLLAGYTLGPLGGDAKASVVLDARPQNPPPTLPTGLAFFDLFDQILAEDPPTAAEAGALAPLAKYGIGAGLSATNTPMTPEVRAALERAVRDGHAHIERLVEQRRRRQVSANRGWSAFDPKVGAFGTDWNLRAMTALIGLWANTPDEALYLIAANDAQGRPLSGRHRYALTFRTPPPAKAFWSLTMYDSALGLFDNPLGRYALGDRDLGQGAVTIRLQHDAPAGSTATWLPAPRGAFTVALRLYVPEKAALSGRWQVPGIRCLDCR